MPKAHTQAQDSARFEMMAAAFVAGVAATLLLLWMMNTATNGRFIQSFFGAGLPLTQYDTTSGLVTDGMPNQPSVEDVPSDFYTSEYPTFDDSLLQNNFSQSSSDFVDMETNYPDDYTMTEADMSIYGPYGEDD